MVQTNSDSADGEKPRHHGANELLPLVYDELRRLAAQRLNHEPAGQTLQPTALVNEAYLRLISSSRDRPWQNRGHFFAAAAEAMRRILIENARAKGRHKRGGQVQRVNLDPDAIGADSQAEQLLAIDDALEALSHQDSQAAELVKLRFFAGLSVEEAAELVGISRSTAYEHWAFARAWIHKHLTENP